MNTQERQGERRMKHKEEHVTCKQKMQTRHRYTQTWEVRDKIQGEPHKPDN